MERFIMLLCLVLCFGLFSACLSQNPPLVIVQTVGSSQLSEPKLAALAQATTLPELRLVGIPTMYGSEPRTYVCIVVEATAATAELIYYLHPDYQTALRAFTGQRLRFNGYLYTGDQQFFEAIGTAGTYMPLEWQAAR